MPINLDAADKLFMSAKADTHRPTYFCSELTGGYTVTGKLRNSGTLRPESDPGAFPAGTRKLNRDDIDVYRRTISNAGTTTYLIPIDLATADMWTRAFDNIELASRDGAIPIAEQTVRLRGTTAKVCAYMTLDAHSVVIEKTKTDSGYVRNARIVWRVSTWFDSCGSTHPATVIHSQPYPAFIPSPNQTLKLCSNVTNAVTVAFVADVPGYLEATLDAFIAVGWTVDAQAAYDALVDIHSYDKIADAADRWQTAIDEDFAKTVDAIVSCVGADQAIRHVHNLVHHLEAYPVPLNLYIKIYNYLKSKFPDYALDEIVESNLNLLMTDTMQRLDDAKSTLETCPMNPQAQASAFFNGGQKAAIESHDPLVMVQSAAGTGKSSTLKGRIQYMVDSGIDPHDITVLSFTNAAADHIRDICPDINSMTISSMVHTIYQENFSHELSSIPTLLNSLDIWFPRGSLASDLKHYLRAVDAHEPDAFTRLNSFVKTNYDGVINLLDGCGQTTLELEIVIAYQKIGTFVEPPEVSSRHLLVDEVQDNSIFDFVYILEYVLKHKESLFIVGDASQTLFEFRGANPRALNIMEASHVFTTFPLEINYRSNQDILDFANVMLATLESNQYANLRLQANSLDPVTAESFKDHVRVVESGINTQRDFRQCTSAIIQNDLKPYIDECLARGEHVCLLAHARSDVNAYYEQLKLFYPNRTIETLVPSKSYDSTALSGFISHDWAQVAFLDRHKLVDQLVKAISTNIQNYVRNSYARDAANEMLLRWARAARPLVAQWNIAVDQGRKTVEEFLDDVRQNMISYEVHENARKKNVQSQKNRQHKEEIDLDNVDIMVSTIHSAKGLEFDNVIVLYKDDPVMREDAKRMYYVALTRAMRSELVLVWSTSKGPSPIAEAYANIVHALTAPTTPVSSI